jgi:hypothetical protein
VRESLIPVWIEMQNFSGVTVLEEKSLRTLLICLHLRLASELTTEMIQTMSLEKAEPWFVFDKKFEYLLTIEAKNYLKKIKDFLNLANSLKKESDEVYKELKSNKMNVFEEFDKIDSEKLPPEDKMKIDSAVNKNKESLEHAYQVISFINNLLLKMEPDVENVQNDLNNKSLVQDMLRISKDYLLMKHYNAKSVVMKYCREKKAIKSK